MGRRRGNGEGSIYKVAGRGWVGMITMGTKRKSVSGKTQREVQDKIDLIKANAKKGIISAPERLTVGQYLTSWLRDTIAPRDTPNTYSYYEKMCRLHIIPMLGHIRLGKLTPSEVKTLLNERRETGLSANTLLGIHSTLKAALSEAMRMELLNRNVAKLVRTSDGKKAEEEKRSFPILTPEQGARLLFTLEDHPWRSFFVVSLMTGIRRAEVCALRWRNIDIEQGIMRIRHTVVKVPHKGTRLDILKGGSKRIRDLSMRSTVIKALEAQRERQQAAREAAGKEWREQDFVFTSVNGDHWHPDTSTSIFKIMVQEAGLPARMTLHHLRHSWASQLLAKGTHPKLVQEQLGHARFTTTMDRYSHMIPALSDEVADTTESILEEGRVILEKRRNRATGEEPEPTASSSGHGMVQ